MKTNPMKTTETWHLSKGVQPLIYTNETGENVAVCYESREEKGALKRAQLIAAAPDLLEALKIVQTEINESKILSLLSRETRFLIEVAIKKATDIDNF